MYLNQGTSFTDVTSNLGVQKSGGRCVSPEYYSGDGCLDILLCGRNNHLYPANTDATYSDHAKPFSMLAEWANHSRWGDFNHDGRLDLVTIGATVLRVFLNTGSGSRRPYTLQAVRNAAVADFNADGSYTFMGPSQLIEFTG